MKKPPIWAAQIDKRRPADKMNAALHKRQAVSPLPEREVVPMVTYDELFAYSLVLIGVATLVFQICKRK